MKSFFKRSVISTIALGMTGWAYASVPAAKIAWSGPQFSGVFLGVEGLDLRPMNGDLDYVTISPISISDSVTTKAINTSYNWDWRVYGGIKFTNNDDITLSWMQMRSSDNSSVTFENPLIPPLDISAPRGLFAAPWDNVNGHVSFDLDDAYGVWGHTVNFSNPWSVRYAIGLEYTKLNSNLRVTADGTSIGIVSPVGFTSNTHLKGIGPRAEVDMTYRLPAGFALFGQANGALLISKRKISQNPVIFTANVIEDDEIIEVLNFLSADYTSREVVVPKFGARLGASYSYVWGQAGAEGIPCRTTTLMVDAGWQVESYIHAIEHIDGGFIAGEGETLQPAPRIFNSINGTKTSNFSNSGLFVGVQLGTDWM